MTYNRYEQEKITEKYCNLVDFSYIIIEQNKKRQLIHGMGLSFFAQTEEKMKIKNTLIKTVIILTALILLSYIPIVFADTVSDLNNQKKDLEEQKKETQSELNTVTKDKSSALKEIEKLNTQINGYEDEIEKLNGQIANLNTRITESQQKLDQATEEYATQEDLLNKRLVTLYKAGETTYLDFILSSKNVTDFLSNYHLASKLASHDLELLARIEQQKKEIEAAKNELEDNKSQVTAAKKEQQAKANSLAAAKNQKETQASKLSAEEKQLKEELEQINKEQRAVDAKIAQITQSNNGGSSTGNPGQPSASGFIKPVTGYSITTGYYGYVGHTGVDYSGSGIHLKPVMAVKDGTVVISEALKRSNGTYYSYGEYIVIDHGNGLSTLYGHGEPGSRKVQAGQRVSQGQTIMQVGTTGNSTGYHLHFSVLVNGKYVNPTPYLP